MRKSNGRDIVSLSRRIEARRMRRDSGRDRPCAAHVTLNRRRTHSRGNPHRLSGRSGRTALSKQFAAADRKWRSPSVRRQAIRSIIQGGDKRDSKSLKRLNRRRQKRESRPRRADCGRLKVPDPRPRPRNAKRLRGPVSLAPVRKGSGAVGPPHPRRRYGALQLNAAVFPSD